jgi:hypothetical protein
VSAHPQRTDRSRAASRSPAAVRTRDDLQVVTGRIRRSTRRGRRRSAAPGG